MEPVEHPSEISHLYMKGNENSEVTDDLSGSPQLSAQEYGRIEDSLFGLSSFTSQDIDGMETEELNAQEKEANGTEEKPYKCEECGYSTKWPWDLKTHKVKHSGNKNRQNLIFMKCQKLFAFL